MRVQDHVRVLQLLNFKTSISKTEGVCYTSCRMICQFVYCTSSCNLDMLAVKFIHLTPVFVDQGVYYVLLVFYSILTLVPLINLVIYCTFFPQYLKVTHFLWFLSPCLSSVFPFFLILYHLVRISNIYGSSNDCFVTCF